MQSLADRLNQAVSHSAVSVDGALIPLSCSIGIGMSDPDDNVDSLPHKADQALYEAKLLGRDRICWYEGVMTPATTGPLGH